MAKNSSIKTKSLLENQKLLAVAIIAAIIVISAVFVIKYGNVYISVFDIPVGVGPVGSDHAHGRLKVWIERQMIDLDPDEYPKYSFASDYIFLDDNKNIHRTAKGATIAMLLEGLGITFTDECLIVNEDTYNLRGELFEKKAYCNEGDIQVTLYIDKKVNEDGPNYVMRDGDKVLVVHQDINITP